MVAVLFFVQLLFTTLCGVILSIERPERGGNSKRIVGGQQLPGRDPSYMPYHVVRYLVYIGNGRMCRDYASAFYLKSKCTPRISGITCGGALITPQIVQTACHCLAVYQVNRASKLPWRPAITRNAWENRLEIYMGESNVRKLIYHLLGEQFITHPLCAKLYRTPYHVSYDFGWIVVDFPIPGSIMDRTFRFIDYAPLYTMEELESTYRKVTTQEMICLVVGFGWRGEKKRTPVLKHTWIQIMDYTRCHYLRTHFRNRTYRYDYDKRATWVCAKVFSKIPGYNHRGDSGSPITCSNQYFAVVSGHMNHPGSGLKVLMYEDPIKFIPKENAAEYRTDFIKQMEEHLWKVSNVDELRFLGTSDSSNVDRVNHIPKDLVKYVRSQKRTRAASSSAVMIFRCVLLAWAYGMNIILSLNYSYEIA